MIRHELVGAILMHTLAIRNAARLRCISKKTTLLGKPVLHCVSEETSELTTGSVKIIARSPINKHSRYRACYAESTTSLLLTFTCVVYASLPSFLFLRHDNMIAVEVGDWGLGISINDFDGGARAWPCTYFEVEARDVRDEVKRKEETSKQ